MKVLLNFFIDLCLLRSAPQQLPASTALFALTLIANVGIGLLLAAKAGYGIYAAWFASLLDSLMLLAFLYGALLLTKFTERFVQGGTALMGSMALLNLIAIPLLSLMAPTGEAQPGAQSVLLALFIPFVWIWSMVVIGHILRHVLSTSLVKGFGLGLIYTMISIMIIRTLFPVGH